MVQRMQVLVVDDDADIRSMLSSTLEYAGYDVRAAASAVEAVGAMRAQRPDVLIADVMMPQMDGYALVQLLRDAGETLPILFLSARDAVEDRVRGLRLGADDYLTKPFSVVEVSARVDALLRRARRTEADSAEPVLAVGPIVLDVGRHLVSVDGGAADLSPTEFRLLELLLQNPERVVSKAIILDRIWGYDFGGDTNIVERFIASLRKKLGELGASHIVTVRGFGYRATAVT